MPDDDALGSEPEYREPCNPDAGEQGPAHSPRLPVVSAAVLLLTVGAIALAISLAVGIRDSGDQLPSSGQRVPNSQWPSTATPKIQYTPSVPYGGAVVEEPSPVVRQSPRTVYLGPSAETPPAVVTPPEAEVLLPPKENLEPPANPESGPEDMAPGPGETDTPTPDTNPEPTPGEDIEPAPEDDAGSAAEADPEAAPEDPGSAGMDPFSVLDRVPADPRLSIGGTSVIPVPTSPLLPSE
ncbi:MAG: hypothetical protein AB7G47_12270 [Mycolicibacterium sp.]|uniref:hypothetical protein n=1 Tax=Mycolicibacterium sp. TaxID=2320850 RepID=UPI003D10EEDE